ncbi:N,N-dimethylformamidase beta subunit family domain-containing protein [Methylomicrobium sp. Wu6]|uniref:N,N-dimethylformamidase beta subunit family domain-containing protein n=1 Tax=Methylomicrobium sp. Wu6 TaxID=3107928 RepID=UPI002DD68C70|nr:N,N-dimethylformamidase beta subunit family domain-containing protein [Methylomicrobium sp. Wu6]MEC4749602.1 DUF6605 domain-containing protein [Methylomicrobium sp. Wu6]
MKNLSIKNRNLTGITITLFVWVASILAMDFEGPVRTARASQALEASFVERLSDERDLVAFSPDGNILANVDSDGLITLWDLTATLAPITLTGQPANTVSEIAFSPDGKILVSVGKDTINLWDVGSGLEQLSIPLVNINSAIVQVAFSPDGKRFAGITLESEIFLWDLTTGQSKSIQPSLGVTVDHLTFSPDGKFLASANNGQKSEIKLWNAVSGKLNKLLPGDSIVTDLAYSPDGKTLASVQGGHVSLWDPDRSGAVKRILDVKEEISDVAFSPDSKTLAISSGRKESKIQLWNPVAGSLIFEHPTESGVPVTHLFFSPDGRLLASIGEDSLISLIDVPTGEMKKLLVGPTELITKAAFNSKQPSLAAIGKDGGVFVWDLVTGVGRQIFQIPTLLSASLAGSQASTSVSSVSNIPSQLNVSNAPGVAKNASQAAGSNQVANKGNGMSKKRRSAQNWKGVRAIAISQDGQEMGVAAEDGTIQVFNKTGKQRWKVSGHHGRAVRGLAFRGKANEWASVGGDTEIKIWDDAGKNLQTFYGPEHPPRAIAASPDDRFIATAGEDTRVLLYDAAAHKLSKIFSGHKDFVNGLAFSPNGQLLASGGADGSILVWDVATGKRLQTLLGHADEVNAVAFNPVGGTLLASASADSTVMLWDITTGQQIKALSGHQGSVRAVAFSPNGKKLVSAGEDTKILVWNPTTGQLQAQLAGGPPAAINALAFGPDGSLDVASENSEITEFNTDTDTKVGTIVVPDTSPVGPQTSRSEPLTLALKPNSDVLASRHFVGKTSIENVKPSNTALSSIVNQLLDWVIPVAEAAIPNPPGGPILVVTSNCPTCGIYNNYYTEILRTEGLNAFAVADISTVTPALLSAYDVVILAQMPLTSGQVTTLTDWVTTAGGNLIAIRPDPQLAGLLGLISVGSTLSDGYLLVDTSQVPGNGIGVSGQPMQFHGTADNYTLNGASSVATLYSNWTTATVSPAVTLRSVGANGGHAAAFAYDLAASIVYTRQGNPAWAAQERDGFTPIRSDDKFYGNASGDPQPDWVDLLNLVAVPQADEQQRLLANLITQINLAKKPLPRFWYFPRGKKAVVIMTGDDHGNGGTGPRFDQFTSLSPAGCNVANWECVRGTSYIYPETGNLSDAQAAAYSAAGFEVGLHINTNCTDFTPTSLESNYVQQIGAFQAAYPSVPTPQTMRHHCLVWSDWITAAQTELSHGIRLDTSFYFWPPSWVNDRPGNFTGSAMPMRFADLSGNLIDVYQAVSHMTDESGQTYPFTINTLLDRALGAEAYYGAYTINAHTDLPTEDAATFTVNSALTRGVPVVSSIQMLTWLDARNNSSFGSLAWNGSNLSFAVSPGPGANGLQAMLPVHTAAGVLVGLSGPGGAAVPYTTDSIKGTQYAFFAAAAGGYTAAYAADTTPPTVTSISPVNGATGVIQQPTVTATFSEPVDPATVTSSNFKLQFGNNPPVSATVRYDSSTNTAKLTPSTVLSASTTYTATILTGIKDLAGNALAAPYTWSFTTQAQPCAATPCSAWNSSATPGTPSVNDPSSVELGVKFKSDLNGVITGIRFYQVNAGTYTAALWTLGGQQLATANVTATTSGWQQVTFSNPVAITANTVYVASYHAPNGNYAVNNSPQFSSSGVDNPPIHLLQDGVSGGNGVYVYSASSTFPTNTYNSSNYWVDVVFSTATGPDTTPPTVTAQSPAPNATGVATNTAVTATFSEALDATTITGANASNFQLQAGSNAPITATVSYANNTATLTPASALSANTTYTATVKGGTNGVKDIAGNPLAANVNWSFTTGASGAPNCSTGTSSIWPTNPTPSVISDSDTSSVELGVKFTSTQNGWICGVRFYKGSTNTGTHVGKLWNRTTGALLASATFQSETASGWQQVSFTTPIAITAGTQYVASYLAPVGRYSINSNYFSADVTSGPLTALSSAGSGGNGVYLYGTGGFPVNTFQATNYWVDVVFTANTGPDTTPPTVTSTSPATGATGALPGNPVTATFSEAVDGATVNSSTFQLLDASNTLVPASYTVANNTATLTPSSSLTASTPYTAKLSGVKDLAGNPLAADYAWSFTTGVDPCSAGGNPIVCENSKTGNPSSEWDITGAGDTTIQGYATDISVNRGNTVSFKIKTDATAYRLDIYRMGFYGGLGARKIASITPSATLPQTQPNCLTNATGLIDCGNWGLSASWSVPADAVSGIYFAKVVRNDTQGASHIVFVVRDDSSTSDLLFQTSDTTWQAYNNYGGNSLYQGTGPGTGGNSAGRAYKVSYNRPFNTRAVDNGQDWVFNAEYPMVRWLEANGYSVSYFTGIDSDRRGNLIANHKVFLSVGHDEYWSGAQRTNVEAARGAGINLAFFSGNEVYWKTRWESSIDGSGSAYRTLVCYKETHNFPNNQDPNDPPTWTGTWRDPRNSPPADGGRPENALLGPIFMVNDGATTSITVPEADGKMRFWRNTSIATLAPGNTATLPNGTLGYEWDVDLDNGVRPAGLIRLSTTIVNNAPILTDFGSTFGTGTANHALTLYRSSNGALVFGAGTVQWPWGLDSNHDRAGTATDVSMQQATVNLFADMNVQPATLQSGLIAATKSTDTTPPVSTITSPAGGSSVALGSNVVISGTATDAGGGLVGGVEVSVDGGATWHPATGRSTWTYSWTTPATSTTVTIKSRAVDDSLNLETPATGISVNVGSGADTTAPTVSMTVPANGATVSGSSVTVSANASDNVGVSSVQFLLDGASLGAPDTVAPYSITWDSTLASNGAHTLSARASDAAGNTATAANISVTVSNTVPLAPSALTATAASSTQINLSWTDNATNENGFKIERCQGAGCSTFAQIATLGSNITAYADTTGLTPNTSYSYRMVAYNGIGNSAYSNAATAVTPNVTGFLSPSSNLAVLLNGDSNGFETTPANAYANDTLFAVDTNSGINTSTSCTNSGKDKHLYYNYNFNIPSGAVIKGIEVRLDALVDSTTGTPKMCVQFSWDGGLTWTATQNTTTLATSEATYVLGSATDTWGRAWTVTNFSNANFRVRVINVASNTSRDFSLDWIAVKVTYL